MKASFASWQKDQERLGIPKGNNYSSRTSFLTANKTRSREEKSLNRVMVETCCRSGELVTKLFSE